MGRGLARHTQPSCLEIAAVPATILATHISRQLNNLVTHSALPRSMLPERCTQHSPRVVDRRPPASPAHAVTSTGWAPDLAQEASGTPSSQTQRPHLARTARQPTLKDMCILNSGSNVPPGISFFYRTGARNFLRPMGPGLCESSIGIISGNLVGENSRPLRSSLASSAPSLGTRRCQSKRTRTRGRRSPTGPFP
jgi:hypothetical protein